MFKTLLVLALLICNLFIASSPEAKTKLSKKYIPQGNPDGTNFYADEDFVESYKLYKKRRELLEKKKLQAKNNKNINKKNLIKTLKEKHIVDFNDESNYQKDCVNVDTENSMINKHGIDLARLKGAAFIDQLQNQDEQLEKKKVSSTQEKKKISSIQEKKISKINVSIQDNSSKRGLCSHDSISHLHADQNDSNSNLNSFESVIDSMK